MAGTYDTFKADENLEKEGIELDYGDAGLFLIARAGGSNKDFARMMEKVFRPYRRQMDAGTMDEKVADKLLAEVFAKTVILDWKGVTDKNGKNLPFNEANATKLLTDLPDLFVDLREQAMKVANFRALEVEADLKN